HRQARAALLRRGQDPPSPRRRMSDDFAPLEQLVDGLLDSIGSGSRRKLAQSIATDLRSANARRIKANVTPGGEPMVPRRNKQQHKRKGPSLHHGSAKVGRSGKKARMALMFRRATGPSILRR